MWHNKIVVARVAFLSLVLLPTPCRAYEEFYYIDNSVLEQRLVDYLKNGPSLLINYPQSTNLEEAKKESGLLVNYGISLSVKSLAEDFDKSMSKKDYYGLVMMACSIPDDDQGIKLKLLFIDLCRKKLSSNKYENAILAFAVQTLSSKRFLTDDESIAVGRISLVFKFVNEIRVKGYDSKDYKMLNKIDNEIIGTCFLELSR